MKNYFCKKEKYASDYGDAMTSIFRKLRYGIKSCKPKMDLDHISMRYELAEWQSNMDHGALSERVRFNYLTWLPVKVYNEDVEGPGYCYNEQVAPNSASMSYTYGDNTENIIEVNSGGCITRINVNPAINIDNSVRINGAYTFTQTTPSASWNITHNLGYPPNVLTMDLIGNEISGVVTHIDNNTLRIDFSQSVSGYAYLS